MSSRLTRRRRSRLRRRRRSRRGRRRRQLCEEQVEIEPSQEWTSIAKVEEWNNIWIVWVCEIPNSNIKPGGR